MTSAKRVASVNQSFLWSFIARFFFFFFSFFHFASFVQQCLPSGSLRSLKNVSLGDDSDQRRTHEGYISRRTTRAPRQIFSLFTHMASHRQSLNSENSLLIHNLKPWQRSSGNSITSSAIVLNRYWNIYSFRPQFNQCCMFRLKMHMQ